MDYEKKYKEALERARNLRKDAIDMDDNIRTKQCEVIFPELKESEDERIRKELLEHCKNQAKPYIYTGNKCPQIQSWIAWLEKQDKETSWKLSKEDDVRRRSTIQILEYARTLNTYNLYGKATIDKNIAWLEKQALETKPKWSEEMKFKKFDIITNGKIEYEIKDIQKNQLGDWVYILYNDSVAKLLSNDSHLLNGSIKWVCEQVDEQFELKERKEEQ